MTDNDKSLNSSDLSRFIGGENWYRHALVRDMLFTDGAKFVADRGGAWWLLDEIALAQRYQPKIAAEEFQLWKLTVKPDRSARLVCENGDCVIVYSKRIPFTDFPLPEVTLYVANRTIHLPSEY